MQAAKVQASLRIRAVSPEPSLLAHTSSEPRGTLRQKARSLAPLNGWLCAVKICHDGMLEDTNSLDGAQIIIKKKKSIDKYSCLKTILHPSDFSMKFSNAARFAKVYGCWRMKMDFYWGLPCAFRPGEQHSGRTLDFYLKILFGSQSAMIIPTLYLFVT